HADIEQADVGTFAHYGLDRAVAVRGLRNHLKATVGDRDAHTQADSWVVVGKHHPAHPAHGRLDASPVVKPMIILSPLSLPVSDTGWTVDPPDAFASCEYNVSAATLLRVDCKRSRGQSVGSGTAGPSV